MFSSIHMLSIFIVGAISAVYFWNAGPLWWLSALAMYFVLSCLGVTITFHRYLAHGSFKFRWRFMERAFIILGHLAGTGSPLAWVAVHKAHHAHSDTDGDPHGPYRGWFNWVPHYDGHVNLRLAKRLLKDPLHRRLHKYGTSVILVQYAALFFLGGVKAVVFLGVLPQAATGAMSMVSNWLTHWTGSRRYETKDDSANVWWLAIPTWGESWHNNHHAKPWRASFGERWWELDVSGMIIHLIAKKGTIK